MQYTAFQKICFIFIIFLLFSTQTLLFSQNKPAPPVCLITKGVSATQVRISWVDSSDNEDGFEILRQEDGTGTQELIMVLGPDVTNTSDVGTDPFPLEPGKTYVYQVQAFNSQGASKSEKSRVVLPEEPSAIPAVPQNLAGIPLSCFLMTLSWSDFSSNEYGFCIQRRTSQTPWNEIASTYADVTSVKDATVLPDTEYEYRIIAWNSRGSSDYADTFVKTPPLPCDPPLPPSYLLLSRASLDGVSLTWIDNANNEDEFIIEREDGPGTGFIPCAIVQADTTTYQDTGLVLNNEYLYRIKSSNSAGDSPYSGEKSIVLSPIDNKKPEGPVNLNATPLCSDEITLHWGDCSSSEFGFRIERKTIDDPSFLPLATISANSVSYSDREVLARTHYQYRVFAFNTTGDSHVSNIAEAITPRDPSTIPEPPGELVIVSATARSVFLSWEDRSINERGFIIQRKTGEGDFQDISIQNAGTSEWEDTFVAPEAAYTYRICSFNEHGRSAYSLEETVTTPSVPVQPPAPPVNLLAEALSASKIRISWEDPFGGGYGFGLERKTSAGGEYELIRMVPAAAISYVDIFLQPETTYYYRLFSYNHLGESDYSNEDFATTFSQPNKKPAAPELVRADALSAYAVILEWIDLSDTEEGFVIQRSIQNGVWETAGTVLPGVTTWKDTNVQAQTSYSYRIAAFNDKGNSSFSNVLEVTTPDPPVSPALSRVIVTPLEDLMADGTASYTIEVIVYNVEGDLMPGLDVELNVTGEQNYITQPRETDDGGYTSGLLSSTKAEEKQITVIINPGPGAVILSTQPWVRFIPGPPYRLWFITHPADTCSGEIIDPPVEIEILDACDNLVTDADNAVSIAIGTNPSEGTLSGSTTKAPSLGVASFDDLWIDKYGTGYTLSVSSEGLVSDSSDSFSILPLTLHICDDGNGTTDPTGGLDVSYGDNVPVTATPGIGYQFAEWKIEYGNVSIQDPFVSSTILTMGRGETIVRALFEQDVIYEPQISTGGNHNLAVTGDGVLWAWGSNYYYGQIGDGTLTDRYYPIQIMRDVAAVAAGVSHSLALKQDGSLYVWGSNNQMELGDGTSSHAFKPVHSMDNIALIAAGSSTSFAVTSEGLLYGWGYNSSGQLGDGTTQTKSFPVYITADVKQVDAGYQNTFVIKDDDTLWGCGHNSYGQIGDGTTTRRVRPVYVMSNVLKVANCGFHTLAIKTDGTLWAWGNNRFGQLGNGSTINRYVPIHIMNDVVAIAGAANHSFALKADGTVWAWGRNNAGQLGDGTNTDRRTPVRINENAVNIDSGGSHAVIIKNDGTLWAWGYNDRGQIGDGTTTKRNRAVQVVFRQGPAHSLVFTSPPVSTKEGGGISPSVCVEVRDIYGQRVETGSHAITLSINQNPGGGTLSGTTTVLSQKGLALFSDIRIDIPATGYSLNASSDGLIPAVSPAFDITCDWMLEFSGLSSTGTRDVQLPPFSVEVKDSSGMLMTSYAGEITIALYTNTARGKLSGTRTKNAVGGVALFDDISINAPGADFTLSAFASDLTGISTWNIQWEKQIGGLHHDKGFTVKQTFDNGFIISGTTESFGDSRYGDVYLVKTDQEGEVVWQKNFGGVSIDQGYNVKQTPDGGYAIAGYTQSFGNAGYCDIYVIKTDSSGSMVWQKLFGNTDRYTDFGYGIDITGDGGLIIAGHTTSYGAVNQDGILIKTDSDGNQVWRQLYGGNYSDNLSGVYAANDGGYISVGYTYSYGTNTPAANNIYLVKTDLSGNIQWQNTYGYSGLEYGYSIRQTPDDGFILAGTTQVYGSSYQSIYLCKIDATGTPEWQRSFGGQGRDGGFGTDNILPAGNGYIYAGYTKTSGFGGDGYLLRVDASGNKVWDKTVGGTSVDCFSSIDRANDGAYIITGYTRSFYASHGEALYLVKAAPDDLLFVQSGTIVIE